MRVGAIDLVLLATTLLTWSWFGLVDLRIALPLTALRVIVWVVHLRACLDPIRTFDGDLSALADDELLALDTSLQLDRHRFVRGYGLGLLLAMGGSAVLGVLGVLPDFALAQAELTALALLTIAVSIAAPEIPRGALDMVLAPLQGRISVVLDARGLTAHRRRSSALRMPIQSTVLFIAGIIFGLGGLAHYMEVRGLRSATEARQQLVVERAANELATTGATDSDVVRIVDESEVPSVLTALIQAPIAAGQPPPPSVAAHEPRRDLVIAAAPTPDGRWIVAEAHAEEHLGIFIVVLAGILLGAVPLMIAALYFNMRRIAQPLQALTRLAERFAQDGELRTLERLHPSSHDELGQLATSFNAMLDNLEQLTDAAEAIAAGELDVELEAPGQLHDAFRAMLDHLANSVTRLRSTSIDVASAAGEIEALTHTQGDAINEQAAAVQQASSTVSSLATSAAQIADAAHEVLVDAEQAAAKTAATSSQIHLLREQTATIEVLLDQIREIADRSDLLALNGSLEATRAGEAGRGFALVASEMRRLAERVTAVVDDVRLGVTAIEAASASAVEVTEDSRRIAGQTAEAARTISAVTAEQSASTEQVADGMVQLADAVINATQAVAQTRAAASGLRDVAAELEQLTRGFRLPS